MVSGGDEVGGLGDDNGDGDRDRDRDDEDDPILAESWKGDWHRLCNNPTSFQAPSTPRSSFHHHLSHLHLQHLHQLHLLLFQ